MATRRRSTAVPRTSGRRTTPSQRRRWRVAAAAAPPRASRPRSRARSSGSCCSSSGAVTLIALVLPGEGRLTDWWRDAIAPFFGAGRWLLPFVLLAVGLVRRMGARQARPARRGAAPCSASASPTRRSSASSSSSGSRRPATVTGGRHRRVPRAALAGAAMAWPAADPAAFVDPVRPDGRSGSCSRSTCRCAQLLAPVTPPGKAVTSTLDDARTKPADAGPGTPGGRGKGAAGRWTRRAAGQGRRGRGAPSRRRVRPACWGEDATPATLRHPRGRPESDPDLGHVRPGPRRGRCRPGAGPRDRRRAATAARPRRRHRCERFAADAGAHRIRPAADDPARRHRPARSRPVAARSRTTRNEEIIVRKLAGFNIPAQIVGRNAGPVVTQYEVQPAPDIKVSRIEAPRRRPRDGPRRPLAAHRGADPGQERGRHRDPEQGLQHRRPAPDPRGGRLHRLGLEADVRARSRRGRHAPRRSTWPRCRTCSSPARPARARASWSTRSSRACCARPRRTTSG